MRRIVNTLNLHRAIEDSYSRLSHGGIIKTLLYLHYYLKYVPEYLSFEANISISVFPLSVSQVSHYTYINVNVSKYTTGNKIKAATRCPPLLSNIHMHCLLNTNMIFL